MKAGETSEETMYRELRRGAGYLEQSCVCVGANRGFRWDGYQSPHSAQRQKTCVGQKRWYLLALNDAFIQPNLDATDIRIRCL